MLEATFTAVTEAQIKGEFHLNLCIYVGGFIYRGMTTRVVHFLDLDCCYFVVVVSGRHIGVIVLYRF